MDIKIGPAGSPEKSTLKGIPTIRELGLNAMEIQFTYGVRMGKELAKKVGKEASKHEIKTSVHAPYYINLASSDTEKRKASEKRILRAMQRAELIGASPVVFHPGYYTDKTEEETFSMVKESCQKLAENLKKTKLGPEITGKDSQFGSLEETIQLCQQVEKCVPVIDFAHIYARNNGHINYKKIFDKLELLELDQIHSHFSGINFSDKGELNHLIMGKPEFKPLAKEIVDRQLNITIISESPVTWKDSLKMKKIFNKMGVNL